MPALQEIEIEVEVDAFTYAWLLKYSEDQPRDEHGRFASIAGAGIHPNRPNIHKPGRVDIRPTDERAFAGKQVETKIRLTNDETKAITEAVAIQHLSRMGFKDAENAASLVPKADWGKITGSKGGNNFPVDVLADHMAVEVKGGQVSNGPGAQQSRVKYGQEPAYMRNWSGAKKLAWRDEQVNNIMKYKGNAVRWLSKDRGAKASAVTFMCIVNPDTRHVDLYRFQGYHERIGWRSPDTAKHYLASYHY